MFRHLIEFDVPGEIIAITELDTFPIEPYAQYLMVTVAEDRAGYMVIETTMNTEKNGGIEIIGFYFGISDAMSMYAERADFYFGLEEMT